MIKKVLIISICLLFYYTVGFSKVLNVNEKRLIKVVGVIDKNIVKETREIVALSKKSKSPIYIMVNTPGGQLFYGNLFIAAMHQAQDLGIKIKCFTTVGAMSMGFLILTQCSEVYVLRSARLMFHPVRIGYMGYLTAKQAMELQEKIQESDLEILEILYDALGLSKKVLLHHFYKETIFSGSRLNRLTRGRFLKIITSVSGVEDSFQITRDKTDN